MAQETETVAALPVAAEAPPPTTLESPSSPSKRRNRKKGRRGSTANGDGEEEDEQEAAVSPCVTPLGDVATADLVSLPSPVGGSSNSNSSTFDAFADPPTTTINVEKAMEQLALTPPETPETTVQAPVAKEDGLLKLPMHPSSGRVPLTPAHARALCGALA